ncbi:hypothetical protein [Methanobrevibacter arboriphilus]|uniref:hypothetical protein n=1 Tax=Methanobrevibacter arboriphilus TaxID=39441 RepID=UPI000A5A99A7|nr:hypothetical protein [Methanobrevibacter arboriphilus]
MTAAGNYVKSGAMAAASAIKTGVLTLATYAQAAAQTILNVVMSLNPIFFNCYRNCGTNSCSCLSLL